jgi:hypothetical protein
MSSSEEGEIFAAALAFIDGIILNPIFSWAEVRFQFFPEFLPHLLAIIMLKTITLTESLK